MNSPHHNTEKESQLESKGDQLVSNTTDTSKDSSSSHSGITMISSSNKSDNKIDCSGYNCTCGNNNKNNPQQEIKTNGKCFNEV